jgi:transcriptional regulator with XRE-family HTH domain
MHPFSLYTPEDVSRLLAQRLKELRLSRKWKRSTLALRSGVSEASLKRFEQTGQISLDSLLKLAFCLGRLDDLAGLFIPAPAASMEELERRQEQRPKRGSV